MADYQRYSKEELIRTLQFKDCALSLLNHRDLHLGKGTHPPVQKKHVKQNKQKCKLCGNDASTKCQKGVCGFCCRTRLTREMCTYHGVCPQEPGGTWDDEWPLECEETWDDKRAKATAAKSIDDLIIDAMISTSSDREAPQTPRTPMAQPMTPRWAPTTPRFVAPVTPRGVFSNTMQCAPGTPPGLFAGR